jgi:crossover junction endodeoxyribonuclease RuvC
MQEISSERRIIGIDPGYDRCGVAIVEGTVQKPRLVFSCCIETDRKLSFPERILFIFKCLSDIMEEHKPTDCSIEDLFFTTNQKTAIKVAEARGVCLLAAAHFKLKIGEYTPLQVKTYLTSYGRADKKQVYFIVEKILKLDFSGKTADSITLKKEWSQKQDDEIDAIAIALTHLFVTR